MDHTHLPTSVMSVASAHAWLLSIWVPIALGSLTVGLLVVIGVRLHRRRRWWTHLPWATAAVSSLVLCVLAGINTYAHYLPNGAALVQFAQGTNSIPLATVTDAAGRPVGRWQEQVEHLADPALDISRRTVIVALPPGYDRGTRRYPVIYLFNGYPGRPVDWFVGGHATQTIDALAARRLCSDAIVVAPDINGGWIHDSETLNAAHGPQVETWVTKDVVSWVDTHLRVRADRADRVLAGMSSGGFAALNVGLRHQEEFGVVAGLEPYGDPGRVAGRLLGGSTALLHANSPDWYIPTMVMRWRTAFYLDVGSRSPQDVARVRELAQLLLDRGQRVDFRIETGSGATHTWAEAAQGLPYALSFAATYLGQPALEQALASTAFPITRRTSVSYGLSRDAELDLLRRIHRHLHPSGSSESSTAPNPSGSPSPTA